MRESAVGVLRCPVLCLRCKAFFFGWQLVAWVNRARRMLLYNRMKTMALSPVVVRFVTSSQRVVSGCGVYLEMGKIEQLPALLRQAVVW